MNCFTSSKVVEGFFNESFTVVNVGDVGSDRHNVGRPELPSPVGDFAQQVLPPLGQRQACSSSSVLVSQMLYICNPGVRLI